VKETVQASVEITGEERFSCWNLSFGVPVASIYPGAGSG